ncbi:MAG: hypothetical protein Q7R60_02950, partial [bacterium]|nr:hypothetical protein [bacterium]
AFAPLASAQCFEYSELGRVLAGPCVQRSILRTHGRINEAYNNYGGYGYSGVGVGGGRVARDIGAGLLGVGIGGLIGGKKGALIGGAVGVGGAELIGHFASRRGGSAAAGPSAGGGQGDFELSNSTRYSVDVYLRGQKGKEKHLGRLSSGDAWAVEAPKPGEAYHGYALIPNQGGGLSSDHLYPVPAQNGWVFTEPPEAIAQGGGGGTR